MARPKKHLSQHFLQDSRVADRIVQAAAAQGTEGVLEIGPGRGALTGLLSERFARVLAVERDSGLVAFLRAEMPPHVELVDANILKTDLRAILAEYGFTRLSVVGNLPYHITTPILFHLAEFKEVIPWAIVMVQKEVADRLVALPGGKDYSLLTVNIQRAARIERVMEVPAASFFPVPKVDSTVVTLNFDARPRPEVRDEGVYQRLVRAMFGQRRKMIRNTIPASYPGRFSGEQWESFLTRVEIKPTQRPEEVPWVRFVELADLVLAENPGLIGLEEVIQKKTT